MIEILLLVGIIITNGSFLYFLYSWKKRQELLLSHIMSRTDDLQAKMVVLGRVLKIFEDETQILQKRNDQMAVKQRFRQTR